MLKNGWLGLRECVGRSAAEAPPFLFFLYFNLFAMTAW